MFPVDFPDVTDTDLTSASERFLSSLESRPPDNEWFELSQTSKVEISSNNVRLLRLFEEDGPDCAVLALHPPDDPTQVVALYLREKWWRVDDILRTSGKSRCGLVSVESLMERLIVFLLSQVVERSSQEGALFSLHPCTESCKLLWTDSQAVGFYSVKHKGSLCDGRSARCYLLPVLDTVLVRRSRRRRGFALQMLQDFCSSFATEEFLGVSSPLSPSMAAGQLRFVSCLSAGFLRMFCTDFHETCWKDGTRAKRELIKSECAGSSCSSTRNTGSVCTRWRLQAAGLNDETSGSTSSSDATPSVQMIFKSAMSLRISSSCYISENTS